MNIESERDFIEAQLMVMNELRARAFLRRTDDIVVRHVSPSDRMKLYNWLCLMTPELSITLNSDGLYITPKWS